MAIIDSTIFEGAIKIPDKDKESVSERLKLFIDQSQDNLTRDLFGYELYAEFKAGISGYDPDGENLSIDQKWMNLINGVEYVKSNGKTDKFNGLKMILARYVYWYWKEDEYTQSVGVGEAKAKAENAEPVNPAKKMIDAWNYMSDDIDVLHDYLQRNKETYPLWEKQDKYKMLKKFSNINHWGI